MQVSVGRVNKKTVWLLIDGKRFIFERVKLDGFSKSDEGCEVFAFHRDQSAWVEVLAGGPQVYSTERWSVKMGSSGIRTIPKVAYTEIRKTVSNGRKKAKGR